MIGTHGVLTRRVTLFGCSDWAESNRAKPRANKSRPRAAAPHVQRLYSQVDCLIADVYRSPAALKS